jgi:hypothetical protein
MLYYPGQDEQSFRIQQQLSAEFNFAQRLFNSWRSRPKNRWIIASPLPDIVKNVAVMLDQQAIRLFRSVVELCVNGEATSATILARSLFESTLALYFVLKPRICIPVFPVLDKSQKPKPNAWHASISTKNKIRRTSDFLTRDFRARLYIANIQLTADKFVKRHANTPGRKRMAHIIAKSVDPKEVAAVENAIGSQWAYILRHKPHTYSGLSIALLSKLLGSHLDKWYDGIYPFQSNIVHASNAARILQLNEQTGATETAAFSRDEEIRDTLRSGCALFLIGASLMSDYLKMGVATDTLLYMLRTEHARLQ